MMKNNLRIVESTLKLGVFIAFMTLSAQAQDSSPTGYFTLSQVNGVWWLIDPNGKQFISKGLDVVDYTQYSIKNSNVSPFKNTNDQKYGSVDTWRREVGKQIASYGFNTAGAWSDPQFAGEVIDDQHTLTEAKIINIGSQFVVQQYGSGPDSWKHQDEFPDVFRSDFRRYAEQAADDQCRNDRDNRWLLGWFSDNELRWGTDWRKNEELLVSFLNLPPGSEGHRAAVTLLQGRYNDISQFNTIWKTHYNSWDDLHTQLHVASPYQMHEVLAQNVAGVRKAKDPASQQFLDDCDAFVGEVAEEYFRITTEAIKRADPNHLTLGCRFAVPPPPPVIYAAAKYLDVVSFNCYDNDPKGKITGYANESGRPLLIGEFCFRGRDSGMPNTIGAGPVVPTQQDRADHYEKYVRSALACPNLVGYHWFEQADEPKEGRFDGENSNYGIVSIEDKPYTVLTDRMTSVNAQAETLHQGATANPVTSPK